MKAKNLTDEQMTEAQNKIERYFVNINKQINEVNCNINEIKNNFHEYFVQELQDKTFKTHYQELLTVEDLIKSKTIADLSDKAKKVINVNSEGMLSETFNPNEFIFAELNQMNDQLLLADLANHNWKKGDFKNIQLLVNNFEGLKPEKKNEIFVFIKTKNWTALKLIAIQATQQLKRIGTSSFDSDQAKDSSNILWDSAFISVFAGTIAANALSDSFSSSDSIGPVGGFGSSSDGLNGFGSSSDGLSGFGGDFGGGGGTANF